MANKVAPHNLEFSMYKSENEMAEMVEVKESKRTKSFIVKPDGRYGMFKVTFEDNKGVLPQELVGMFTSQQQAEKAVDDYLKRQKPIHKVLTKEEQEAKEKKAREDFEERMKDKESKKEVE